MSDKLPKGWKKVKLGEVVGVNPSESLKRGTLAKKVPMEALQPFTKKIQFFIFEQYKGGVKFKNGDTLVARITPSLENGKTVFVDFLDDNEIGFGSTEFIVLRALEGITDMQFLYYFAISPEFRDIAIKSMTGSSGRQRVQIEVVKEFEFLLPSLPEQRAIASVLSSLDDKIDLLHRQNKILEQMAETIFRKWFVEDAKEDWEEVRLGDVLENIESGSRPKGGIDPNLKIGVPSIGAENINGLGNFDFSKVKYVSHEYFNRMKRGVVRDYDILIYKDGAYIGRKSMFGKGFPFEKICINEHVFILRANCRISQFFLYFLLDEEELRNLNTNSAQPGLNQASIKNLIINPPSKNLMRKFDEHVKPLIDKIFANGKQIRTLEKLRDTLLPKLMSGEVRIDVANRNKKQYHIC